MAGKTIVSDNEDEVEFEDEEREPAEGDAVEVNDRDDEDDEDDEEGQDEYEKDGFIVDDVDEEEPDEEEEEKADSDEERKKRKKKRRVPEKEYLLDEDNYELLQDNNITGFHRPKLESKKIKRLKKAQRGTEEERSGFSDEEEFDGSGKAARTAEEKLERRLFGDDEGPPLEDIAEEEEPPEQVDVEEDEMADFIVEEVEVDENGIPVRRRKPNKKKSRQAQGVSATALQEAHDIFGDVDELLRLRKQGLVKMSKYDESGEWRERRLEDEFEPIVLSEKYMTEKDDRIREIDIPERMQIYEEGTGPPPSDEMSIEEESNWIYNQLVTGIIRLFSKGGTGASDGELELSVNKDDIIRFLELTHVQKFDVPFIALYRKEECLSLFMDPEQLEDDTENQNKPDRKPTIRWHKVLWAIQELDRKWLLIQKRKSALQSYYNKRFEEESRRIYDEARLTLNDQLFESIAKSLKAAESDREVDDVDSKFNLHFPPGEVGVDEGQYKRPKRKSQYSICSKAGLWEVASKFGYSSEQFGLQISLEKMRMDELEDAKEIPEEMASNFTCAMFESPQAVLRGARHMAALEISCEPCVRKHVRSIFMDNAVVSTTPIPDGNVAIDTFHQFAGVKWLRDKPITRFEDAQWLLIQKAEEEKLLQVTIKLPDSVIDKLIADSNDYYLSDGVSKSAQLWNEQRKMILQDAFFGFLLPSMEKEARSFLTSRAKNWLLMEYGKLLWDKVSVAPYPRKEHDLSSDDEAAPRVMACCWGPGKPSTTFVMLDSSGEVVDTLDAGFLSIRSQHNNDQQRRKNDHERIVKFMTDHQPHVVVLGAVNLSCTKLKEDIYEIIFKNVEDNPRDVGHGMDGLSIVYGDESLPHLYENSRISSDQLSGHSGIVRRAVALGRFLQNPLAMVATLCGPGKEMLSWKLSPLESFLTPDEKYGMVEQVMVDVTNQVGLDVNLAIAHEWLVAPLQFISGLGPRKAASLQRSLVRAGSIYTRKDLLTNGLGKKVFVNAVGFLRIRRTGLAASSSQFIDLLDDTRINPESYGLAQELAKDIYNEEVKDGVNDDDDALEIAIEHVREKSELLRCLKVDEYAKSKNWENKRETLNTIKLELIQGFQDWRRQYTEPSQDDQFYMISGETEDTLAEGRIVQVTVRRVQPQRAVCVLESGLTGMLTIQDYTDDWRDNADLSEKLHEGDILTCRIKSIQKNRYQVFLTCKENRFQSDRPVDPFYHEDQSSSQSEQEKARKQTELAKKHFKPRMIVNPRFQNITAEQAMQIAEGSENSEQLLDEGSPEHEIDSQQVCGIDTNDLKDNSDHVIGLESNDFGDENMQVVEFGSYDEENNSEQVLGIESNHHENDSDQILEIDCNYHENGRSCDITVDDENGLSQGKGYPPPLAGMEFESYDDAYNYYNCYAKELGFAIRVKSSWTKRNSKEKRGAVLCCNCEGFKTIKEANSRRKETRTGCLAMIRLRLVESNRWRVDEVKLEHNHLFDHDRAQNSKSHKKMDAGVTRKREPPLDVEVRTIKLYRTSIVDSLGHGCSNDGIISNRADQSKSLKLKKGDAQVIYNYFCHVQLTNPNFFYLMDLNDEGHLRNVFWIDSKSRAAYGYFGDVVALDMTCLSNKYGIPLLAFVGVNHHGHSILLGCCLLADETPETYIWLLRAWLTCMLGCPPQTILTDQCKALQTAIAEVFPRAHHRLYLPLVMQSTLKNVGQLKESEVLWTVLSRTVHNCIKVDEFETAWEDMVKRFGISNHEWLQSLYQDRERWSPVYSKDIFFAGMLTSQPDDLMSPFFDGYVHEQTTLKEFFDMYELVLQTKYQKESLDDLESNESMPVLKTSCPYETQLSEVYTKEIFLKFQEEVEMMASCLSITQIHANGPVITYMVKEREEDGNFSGIKNLEVMYDKTGVEVRCICSCFNFKGYLCRHSLSVLNYNGVEEIPGQYVLSRWRKDFKRLYVPDVGSNSIDIRNPVQWYDHLYRRALQVVEEGMTSQDRYMVAWQAFKESLNKVRLVADKHV